MQHCRPPELPLNSTVHWASTKLEFWHSSTKLTFENTTPLKTIRKTEFNLDEPFEVDLMGLADKQTHINSFSGNVLTTKDVGSDKVVAIRTFNADGFSMKMFGPNDVTAVRHFKRV